MKLSLSPALLLSLTLSLVPTIASAQYNDTFSGSDNRDPFSRASRGDTSGLLNIINQAQINKNNPNATSQQREQINSATEDFRSRQIQLLRERNKKNSQTSTTVTP